MIPLSEPAFAFVKKVVALIEQQRMIETALSENVVSYIHEEYGVDLKSGEWELDTNEGMLKRVKAAEQLDTAYTGEILEEHEDF